MALFTSTRERRLWLLTLAVVAAIYSTLGLTGELAAELRNRDLIDTIFFWTFVVIVAAVVIVAFHTRPGAPEIGVWLAVGAVCLMVFLRMAIPEERTHLVEYGVVALLLYEALTERARHGRPVPRPAVTAIIATAVVGVVDEAIQAVLPNRVFDIVDIGFNALAGFMAVSALVVLRRVRRGRPAES